MNSKSYFLVILCLGFFSGSNAFAQSRIVDQRLSQLIDSLYTADQNTAKIKPSDSAAAAFQRTIRTNFPQVKATLEKHGFPGYNLVGKTSSEHYFLLVQHSDFDLAFQKRALSIMERQVRKKNASGQQYAMLVDRININEGKAQIYGTQIIMSGDTKLKPCIDINNLDKRRKSVGLSPIAEYIKKCNDYFYEMNPQQKRLPSH